MTGRFPRAVAVSIAGAVCLLNIYRAATQSITHDEALTYEWFVKYPWWRLFAFYDPNHHVLYTILCKLAVGSFGLSELTLRLPSVLGGVLYVVMIVRLADLGTGGTALFLPTVAALLLHPYVLDFLSAARGYGLALGCLLAAVDRLVRWISFEVQPATPRGLHAAGVWLGLAVASNLAFLFPAVGLIAAFLTSLPFSRARTSTSPIGFVRWARALIVPAIVTAVAIVALPLTHASRSQFYYGASTLNSMVNSLVHVSFLHGRVMRPFDERLPGAWFVARALTIALPAVASLALVDLVRRRAALSPWIVLLILIEGTMIVTLVLLKTAREAIGLVYPLGRTALYWVPLLLLTVALLARDRDGLGRWVRWPAWVLLLFCVVQFGRQLEVDYYADWPYDASTKKMITLVIDRHHDSDRETRIAATWVFEPSLNFYRDRYRLSWVQPIARATPSPGFDYYVLLATDRAFVAALRLRPIFTDDVDSVLAVPR